MVSIIVYEFYFFRGGWRSGIKLYCKIFKMKEDIMKNITDKSRKNQNTSNKNGEK